MTRSIYRLRSTDEESQGIAVRGRYGETAVMLKLEPVSIEFDSGVSYYFRETQEEDDDWDFKSTKVDELARELGREGFSYFYEVVPVLVRRNFIQKLPLEFFICR